MAEKISAVIVTEESEPYLSYCLKSIKDIVDEVVLESTPFDGIDFSSLRNKTIEKATGDWILVLDGDEILANLDGSPIQRKQLDDLITSANENGYYGFHIFTIHFLYNYKMIDGNNGGNHLSYARFFRKSDFVQYRGKIHEMPEFKDGQNLISTRGFAIWHFGHCKGMEFLREKYKKRMKIEGNPFRPAFANKTVDEYCTDHDLFQMTRPVIFYNGHLPKVLKLW